MPNGVTTYRKDLISGYRLACGLLPLDEAPAPPDPAPPPAPPAPVAAAAGPPEGPVVPYQAKCCSWTCVSLKVAYKLWLCVTAFSINLSTPMRIRNIHIIFHWTNGSGSGFVCAQSLTSNYPPDPSAAIDSPRRVHGWGAAPGSSRCPRARCAGNSLWLRGIGCRSEGKGEWKRKWERESRLCHSGKQRPKWHLSDLPNRPSLSGEMAT